MIKLVKNISQSGFCSRRAAQALILAGKVSVNGHIIQESAFLVDPEKDKIQIDGKRLQKKKPEIFVFHKPVGYLTSHRDPHHKKVIFNLLPDHLKSLKVVGRLDMMTSGLLLLTNQSIIQTYLENPAHQIPRIYQVRVYGHLPPNLSHKLAKGIKIDRINYAPIQCKTLKQGNQNHWLELTLSEGKNREIRTIMAHYGLKISKLHRVAFGSFALETLPTGNYIKAPPQKIATLLEEINANH